MIVCDGVTDAYGRIADRYAGPEPGEDDPAWRRACRELFMRHTAGKRVLEIGCGPGTDAAALAAAGYDVVATDGAPEFVRIVGERFPELEARVLDFTHISDHWRGFDAIFGHSCLLHVGPGDLAETLRGLHACLGSGGLLFLAMAQSEICTEHVVPDWGGMKGNDLSFHYHRVETMSDHLAAAGFDDVAVHHLGWSDDSPYLVGPPAERIARLKLRPYQILAFR